MNLQNKSVVLNVVLAIAVVVLGVRLVSGAEDAGESQTQEQAVLDNIATRTSIRDYEARPVEKEKVEKMLRAAMAAPTAMNKQPWHFVVVDQRSVLDSLAGAYPSENRCKAIGATLSLPDNLIPLNMVVIGYPAEHPQPKDKFKEENITFKSKKVKE